MINKTKMEAESIEHAGRRAGEFIESLMLNTSCGSDLSKWTPEVYTEFIEITITAFVERMQEIKIATDNVPY